MQKSAAGCYDNATLKCGQATQPLALCYDFPEQQSTTSFVPAKHDIMLDRCHTVIAAMVCETEYIRKVCDDCALSPRTAWCSSSPELIRDTFWAWVYFWTAKQYVESVTHILG